MDTIGAIRPAPVAVSEPSFRLEVLERMRYLAVQRKCGVLLGKRGCGKTELLNSLCRELREQGIDASTIDLTGMDAQELAFQVATELGIGPHPSSPPLRVWTEIQDYARSCHQSGHHNVLLFDQLDRADLSLKPYLERLISLFDGAFSCLFAGRPKIADRFKNLIKSQAWMVVELQQLTPGEVGQSLARESSKSDRRIAFTDDAVAEVHSVTAGRLDKLKRLTQLAMLAAEAEELPSIDAEIIRALQHELHV